MITLAEYNETIGSGSYGEVYIRQFKEEKVAYKKFKLIPGLPPSEILKEVKIMKNLNHQNIVRMIGVVADPNSNKYGLVMEFYESGSLYNLIHIVSYFILDFLIITKLFIF